MSSAGLRMPALLPREPVAQGLREHVLQGSSGLPAGLTYSRFPQTLQPSGPCRLTWAEHWDAPPPALGTRMNTGHPRVIESRGLVCKCEGGVSRKQRGRERAHASSRLPSGFARTPGGDSRTVFMCLPWGTAPPHLSIPHTGLERLLRIWILALPASPPP